MLKSFLLSVTFTLYLLYSTVAQEKVDFPALEKALKVQNREGIEKAFGEAFDLVLNAGGEEASYQRLLDISHELSRSGFARTVWLNLGKLAECLDFSIFHDKQLELRTFLELGAACYYDNKFEKSDSVFSLILRADNFKAELSSPDKALALNFLGLVNRKLGYNIPAIDFFNQARQIRMAFFGENHPSVAAVVNNLGLTYKSMGDYENARLNLEKAVAIKNFTGDASVFVNYLNLGELSGLQGDYQTSLKYYKQAGSLLRQEERTERAADLFVNMGVTYYTLQAFEEAMQYFRRALSIYDLIYGKNNEKSGKVYQNLANVYNGTDDRANEQKSLLTAIQIYQDIYGQDKPEIAPLYNNLGLAYQNHGQYDLSLSALIRARNIYIKNRLSQPENLPNSMINMAETFRLMGKQDSSVSYLKAAIAQLDSVTEGRHPYLAYACNLMTEIYLDKNDLNQAGYYVRKAIASNLRDSAGSSGNTLRESALSAGNKSASLRLSISVRNSREDSLRLSGENFITAGKIFQSGILESCLDPGYLFKSLLLSSKIAAGSSGSSSKNLVSAFLYLRSADSLLSVQRNFLFDKSDKITFARNAKDLAETALEFLSNADAATKNTSFSKDAFRFMDKSKNLVLLQSLNEKDITPMAGIPASVIYKVRELSGIIQALSGSLETEESVSAKQILEEKLFNTRIRYKRLVDSLEATNPSYADKKYAVSVPSFDSIQHFLDNKTALITYFSTDKAIFRFTVLRRRIQFEKCLTVDLEDLLVGFRKGITLHLDKVYIEKATALFRLLIPGNLPSGTEKLIIVPDGGLSLIPFEALLCTEPENISDYGQWPLLLNKYVIRYASSASLWFRSQKRTHTGDAPSLLAVAPGFEIKPSSAPANLADPSLPSKITGIFSGNGKLVPPLMNSRKEVLRIDSLFQTRRLNSKVLIAEEASEKNFFRSQPEKYSYIHIASHGFVDEMRPGMSGLLFYPAQDSSFDNILSVSEMSGEELNATLVTLSACQTGLGKIASGEGILGFSRAFQLAGAKNLLLSLWNVNDSSTATLMTSFYQFHLNDGFSLHESLRKAKIRLLSNPSTAHPYFWAPFILIGG